MNEIRESMDSLTAILEKIEERMAKHDADRFAQMYMEEVRRNDERRMKELNREILWGDLSNPTPDQPRGGFTATEIDSQAQVLSRGETIRSLSLSLAIEKKKVLELEHQLGMIADIIVSPPMIRSEGGQ